MPNDAITNIYAFAYSLLGRADLNKETRDKVMDHMHAFVKTHFEPEGTQCTPYRSFMRTRVATMMANNVKGNHYEMAKAEWKQKKDEERAKKKTERAKPKAAEPPKAEPKVSVALLQLLNMINASTDPKTILGVPLNAAARQIKMAYMDRARKVHPDKCSHELAHTAFQKVSAAYQSLIAH